MNALCAPTRPDPAAEPASFSIQAASFRNEDEADRLRASLLLKNIPATVDRSVVSGATWYRVRVGPFENLREAQAYRREFERTERMNTLVVRRRDAA